MSGGYVVWGAPGSGSVAVEAALTLIGAPYRIAGEGGFEAVTQSAELAAVNPMRQVPAVRLPSGELMTESAAILIHLGEAHPDARLAPPPGDPRRPQFLRWMAFIAGQIYPMYWIRDVPSRLAEGEAAEQVIEARTRERITDCWRVMAGQLPPAGRYLLGDELSLLDLYVTVISRWTPNRRAFYEVAPAYAAIVKAVDADPRLAKLWAERMPFEDGWEG
jgi:GST-like protein